MKALLCTRYGTPDDLELADIPDPTPGPGEAVVRIAAAALNFFDTLIIAGKYQTKPDMPFSPAAEFAGIVESVGAGVTAFKAGDRVLGYCGYGAARERIALAAERLVKLPPALDFDRAAGICVTYGTTLYALKDRAQLKSGETLAVLGASGGVGLAAVELGKFMGARVIACASSPEKLEFARKHGADIGIDYAKEDLKDALRAATSGKGADVIYDPVGGPYAESALRSIAWEGRFLVIGFAAGDIPKLPLNLVLLKSADVRGVFWGAWIARDPAGHRANTEQLL
jgi:NADPH2:quinone reductase